MTDWAEREQEIRKRLGGPLSPAADFGWAVSALRDAMAENKRLQSAAFREQTEEAKAKPRKERKT